MQTFIINEYVLQQVCKAVQAIIPCHEMPILTSIYRVVYCHFHMICLLVFAWL